MLLSLALALALVGACRPGDEAGERERPEPLLVLAAADLQSALEEVRAAYVHAAGQPVTVVYGSSGLLAAQIRSGAPADLYFAADERFVDILSSGGLVREESRRTYGQGRLALAWGEGVAPVEELTELVRPDFDAVAIANPEHAPYGRAAREALQRVGAWAALEPRLVLGENVAQTLQFIRTGNADAGIVALGLVRGTGGWPHHRPIPDSLHAPLRQTGVVLRGSERPVEALRFLDFLTGPEGQEILAGYGFGAAEP